MWCLSTLLHERAHAVYPGGKMPADLPYLLRWESQLVTTEGLGLMFQWLATDAELLRGRGIGLDDSSTRSAAGEDRRCDQRAHRQFNR